MLLVSSGLDLPQGSRNATPLFSPYLDQAISEAQRRGVAIFTFYAPSVGETSKSRIAVNYGQGSLNRLADETGGPITRWLRPPLEIEARASATQALLQLRQARQTMAIILDPRRGFVGIVTPKDIVEEILGELAAW